MEEVVLVSNQNCVLAKVANPTSKAFGSRYMWAARTSVPVPLNLLRKSVNLDSNFSFGEMRRKQFLEIDIAEEDQTRMGYSMQQGATGEINHNCTLRVLEDYTDGILNMLSKKYKGALRLKVNLTMNSSWVFNNISMNRGYYTSANQLGWSSIAAEGQVAQLEESGTFGLETEVTITPCSSTNYHAQQAKNICTVTITAVIPDSNAEEKSPSVSDKLGINKKILKDEIASDVTIISNNGAHIKCHKNFLSAHSPVLATMFQTSMRESKTSKVEMPDMTEDSIRAFLAYLYYWETKEPTNNSLVCFELLNAGHKYDIPILEDTMQSILLSKNNNWYDVDVAMRLFLFSRNLPEGDRLKMKAIQVLKSKFSVLEQSPSYQDLFKKDPKAAMELCKYAFSV